MPVTRKAFLMGRDKEYPLTAETERNANALLAGMHELEKAYGREFEVSSG